MVSEQPTPVFVFSLPRSGSTLLQRILASHASVATASEPWILLPMLMTRNTGGVYAVYRHEDAVLAINQFTRTFPGGPESFDHALRDFVLGLYRMSAGPAARYFVDKTPRYHLVAQQIIHLFPDAKFIFLWRNPISVVASIIRTWGSEGRWNVFRYQVDLERGPANLVDAYLDNQEKALAIQYEQLVSDPDAVIRHVFEYLDLDYRPAVLAEFGAVELSGAMGDPTGVRYGSSISTNSVDSWDEVLNSPVRQAWVRAYLRRLGDDTLAVMGYSLPALINSMKEAPTDLRTVPQDLALMAYGIGYRAFDSLVEWRSRRYLANTGREFLRAR